MPSERGGRVTARGDGKRGADGSRAAPGRVSPSGASRGFQVGPGTLVALSYDLYDGEGELVESSDDDAPLEVVFGHGQLAAAVERALEGLEAGASTSVVLEAGEAFGSRRDDAVIEVERTEMPPDARVGDEYEAEGDDGAPVALKVLEVTDDTVLLDTNHPLAGQEVRLDLTVEAVRPATDLELEAAASALEGLDRPIPPGDLIRRRHRGYEKPPAGPPRDGPGEPEPRSPSRNRA